VLNEILEQRVVSGRSRRNLHGVLITNGISAALRQPRY
jgi:hypothetical protein